MRKIPALTVAAGLLISLTSCAGGPFADTACHAALSAGDNSALVTADGDFGADPQAEFPTPLVADSPEAQILSGGDGRLVSPGDTTVTQITIYDGKSGQSLVSTDYAGEGLIVFATDTQPQFGGVTQCATVGSRVVSVGTAGELIGQADIDQNQLPLTADDTVVLVVDVISSFIGKANGVDQFPQAGFPSVVLAPNGQPGFTFPGETPPDDLRIALLKAGNGATVKKGDAVVVNYTGLLWGADDTFDSSWGRGRPAVFTAESLNDASGGLVPGFAKALIGQKVGSQVVVVIPPDEGYPAGQAPASIPEGSTMVFVFDVLGIQK